MLETLKREFLDWLEEPTDDQLSLHVLEVVQSAYTEDDDFPGAVDRFVRDNRERLNFVFDLYRDADEPPFLLFQPEVLAIAERLEHGRAKLSAAWQQSDLPYDLLDELATALSRPLGY
jgi:hypothetical protein